MEGFRGQATTNNYNNPPKHFLFFFKLIQNYKVQSFKRLPPQIITTIFPYATYSSIIHF